MVIKKKNIYVLLLVLSVFITLLLPLQTFAAEISGITCTEVTDDNIDDISTDDDVVFCYNQRIYYANAKNLFMELKEKYGDEIVQDTNGEDVPWSKISKSGDSMLDADSFRQQVSFTGSPGTALTSTLKKALTFEQKELNYPVTISELLIPLALTLLCANMLMEMNEISASGIKSLESIMFTLLKFAIGFGIIGMNTTLIVGINAIGQDFLEKINNLGEVDFTNVYRVTSYCLNNPETVNIAGDTFKYTQSLKEIAMACDQDSLYLSATNHVGAFGQGLSAIFQSGANLILSVMCYALKITFTLRLVTLPITYADIPANGLKGKGYSYIKGTIGEALSIGLVMAMCVLSSKISTGTGGMAILMLPLSCIGAFNSVKTLAKEAFG